MKRTFAIPSTAALGVGLGGCLTSSLPGEWEGTAWMSILLPFEEVVEGDGYSYSFRVSTSMTIEDDLEVEASIAIIYAYDGERYTERYSYFGDITREGRRQYEIDIQPKEDSSGLILDCALRTRDLLDCDSDGEVFTFEREG